jgi:deoxyribodipyrimidine photo-lyase
VYSLDEMEAGRTHDPLCNAAQMQLVQEGRLHNYLAMLWEKRILDWSATPRDELAAMIELSNKCALDGRDPNSSSGVAGSSAATTAGGDPRARSSGQCAA